MSNSIVLSIAALQSVVAGKFVTNFAVVDEQGNLVGAKAHKTEAEAKVELGSLKYYAEGLAFARSTAKEGTTDKALVGKANIVAAYLIYKEQPVEAVVESTEEASDVVEAAQEEF